MEYNEFRDKLNSLEYEKILMVRDNKRISEIKKEILKVKREYAKSLRQKNNKLKEEIKEGKKVR